MTDTAPLLTFTPNPALDVATRTTRIEPEHKLRCAPALLHPGGGGINVARVITRLGGQVTAVYPAGGATGERLQQLVAGEGVQHRVVRIAGETRENFSVMDDTSGHEYRFVLPGPALSAHEWQECLEHTCSAAVGCVWVIASGSLPSGVPLDGYGQLARRLGAMGVRLVLDASGPVLAAGLREGVHLFKPSLGELQELTGGSLGDMPARLMACRSVIGQGQAQVVALSMGAAGALLVTATQAWHAKALTVPVASTIGAGDSFLGGLVWTLARGDTPEDALRHAMATAAAALLAPGTSLCNPADAARLLPAVCVTPMD